MTKEVFNEKEERARTECYELVKYRDRARLMTFILRDETRHSFGYDSLYGAHFHGRMLRVEFTRNTVVVEGRNLALLHRAMTDHRVIYVRELPAGCVARQHEPSVERIVLQDRLQSEAGDEEGLE